MGSLGRRWFGIGELGTRPEASEAAETGIERVRFRALCERAPVKGFVNDDGVKIEPGSAVVVDGMYQEFDCGHTATGFVRDLKTEVAGHLRDRRVPVAEAVARGIDAASKDHREGCWDDPGRSPRAALAVARFDAASQVLQGYSLADVALLVKKRDGAVDVLQDKTLDEYAWRDPATSRVGELRREWVAAGEDRAPGPRFPDGDWSGSPEQRRQFDQDLDRFAHLLEQEGHRFSGTFNSFRSWLGARRELADAALNNPDVEGGGFFAAVTDPDVAYQGWQAEWPVEQVLGVAVTSDRGFELATLMADARRDLPYGLGKRPPYTPETIFRVLEKGGVSYLHNAVRRAERFGEDGGEIVSRRGTRFADFSVAYADLRPYHRSRSRSGGRGRGVRD